MNKPWKYTDDRKLWEAFRQGEEAAYAQLYEQYAPALYSYGMKIARDEALVKDCIQDLFIHLWNNRRTLGQVQAIKFYLSSSLRRDLIRKLQRNKTTSLDAAITYDFDVSLDFETMQIQDEIAQEQLSRLNRALQQLPTRQKEALYLKYYENLSYAEIADMMAITPGVAYNFVYRALSVLKKYLLTLHFLLLLTAESSPSSPDGSI
ncbi:RNA polymerase sigma factor [Larkinella bovis]|uniref:RNA polymerase sigma factor n=1 Tax=Larkinella bovis TaxID=683041 RepID=A0ABW0I7Z4_9BACT